MSTTPGFWDAIADKYAATPIPNPEGYEDTLAIIRRHLRPRAQVLEVGCGTGTSAIKLASAAKSIIATDFSPALIEIAKRRAQEAEGSVKNVRFEVADVMQTPGKPGSYDAVLAFNVLHTLPDAPAALRALNSKLRPGGILASKTVIMSGNPFYRIVIPVMQFFGRAPHISFFSAADVSKMHRDANFEVVETKDYENGGRRLVIAKKSEKE